MDAWLANYASYRHLYAVVAAICLGMACVAAWVPNSPALWPDADANELQTGSRVSLLAAHAVGPTLLPTLVPDLIKASDAPASLTDQMLIAEFVQVLNPPGSPTSRRLPAATIARVDQHLTLPSAGRVASIN
jgi:hypothetical protein